MLKSNSRSFRFFKKNPRMNNKKITKRGQRALLFIYELSIVVLIDFIAILLTPGIFLIQIVNTIFIVKIILKCIFPKVGF